MKSIYERTKSEAEKLLESLKKNELLSKEDAEAVVHALLDISESVENIYSRIIPALLS